MKQCDKKEICKETVVTEAMLASTVGSGSLKVYATPMVAALMENAASSLAQEYVDDGCTTVGTMIHIEHTSPTPVGAHVEARAALKEIEGRTFRFDIAAFDDAGMIARGTHERVSVRSESFQKKADSKFSV